MSPDNTLPFHFAIQSAEDGIWEYDISTGETRVSAHWLDMIGYSESEYHSSVENWKTLIHPDDLEAALGVFEQSIRNKVDAAHAQYRVRHKNGAWLWIYDRAKIRYDDAGNPLMIAGFRTDITRHIELEQHNQELSAILQNASIELYIVDETDLKYKFANEGALRALGYTLDELKGMHLYDIDIDLNDNQIAIFRQYFDTISPFVTNISRHRRKNGSFYPVQSNIRRLTYEGESALILFDTDITELSLTQERLNYLATHDPLTSLPNRLLFQDWLRMSIKQAKRNFEKIAVLYIDLDNFKQINDSLGHQTGDKLLIATAEKLKTIFRDSDTVSRMGGDEFNVLICGLEDTQPVIEIVQKLINAFEHPFSIDGRELYTSLSVGISIYPDDGETSEVLMKNADTALYRAKSDGRKTYQFYANELSDKIFERVVLENALRSALKAHQFTVFYQMQIDMISREWIGMEALVRWNHPTLGLVSPATFIPLCEENGLIQEIDFYVLETVIQQHARWREQHIQAPRTAINFSARTLGGSFLSKEIGSLLSYYNVPSSSIAMEITESHIMKSAAEAIRILTEVRDLGIEVHIDDFGTGYSSLAYLKRLPIDKLKIDQSFIREIPSDDDDMAITKTVIDLARNLQLDVIAEGVETIDQESFLINNGCLKAQGYRYARPADGEMITLLLKGTIHYT